MNQLTTVQFEGNKIRTVVDENGIKWWVARDIALSLGYPETSLSHVITLIKCVPEKWRGRNPVETPSGEQIMTCLTQEGVNFFCARTDKPAGVKLLEWLSEVGTAVQTKGEYSVLSIEQRTKLLIEELDAVIVNQQKVIENQRPLVEFAEDIQSCNGTMLVGAAAKAITDKGIEIGQNRLFTKLRDWEWIGEKNIPYQTTIQSGLMLCKTAKIKYPSGNSELKITPLVTGKGLKKIWAKLKDKEEFDKEFYSPEEIEI